MRRRALLSVLLLAGCARAGGESPEDACARQAYSDPVVADIIRRGAGTDSYKWDNETKLRQAKQDATVRCLRARGLAPKGGVERARAS